MHAEPIGPIILKDIIGDIPCRVSVNPQTGAVIAEDIPENCKVRICPYPGTEGVTEGVANKDKG